MLDRFLGLVPGFEAGEASYSGHLMRADRERGIVRDWGSGEESLFLDESKPEFPDEYEPGSPDEEILSVKEERGGLWGDMPFDSLKPTPDLRTKQLSRLLISYARTLHKLCPLFDLDRVHGMVRQFSRSYSPTDNENFIKPGICIGHSLSNVIVLLIFALGEVCEHQNSLPIPDNSGPDAPRNTAILPGLTYYASAASILGPLRGSTGVNCAQAMILAALFQNQYGRFSEGWGHIQQACVIVSTHVKRQVLFLFLGISLLTEQET
jgi:hypothetical protein